MTFKGHEYDHRHYTTPRRIEGFYPNANKDAITGRWALAIVCALVFLYAIGVNL